jgi:hypothetical protein
MSNPFWITGLPRSRTAWFAVAMRGPRSSCAHELTATCQSLVELKSRWLYGSAAEYRGNSDSACGLNIERIMADIRPRTLIIRRPIGEVMDSLSRFMGYDLKPIAGQMERLDDALDFKHALIKAVAYKDLTDRECLSNAVEWLVPCQVNNALSLMTFNIQAERDYALALMRAPHSHWHMQEAV